MNKFRSRVDQILYIFVFIFLSIVYFSHAPHTVQTGDSGELSAAAYKLLVSHPPGYPLWIWLNHLWLQTVSTGTTYFSLATFNIVCSLATLWIIGKCLPSNKAKLISITSLGISYLFWKFSMIPEVFMLNLLLAFAVIYTGNLKTTWGKLKLPAAAILMPLFFSLGIANHHTILFILPYVTWVCWKHKKSPWLYLSILFGVLMCMCLYSSMLGMNPAHPYSWGNLNNLGDIWNHFLRKDYGTLGLHPSSNENSLHLLAIFLIEHTLLTILPLLLISTICIVQFFKRKTKLIWSPFNTAISLSLLAYVFIFIPMMQMAPLYTREEIVERFLLLPISLSVLVIGKFLADNYDFSSKENTLLATAFTCLFVAFSLSTFSHDLDYSENTILSDYSQNILHVSSEFKNPVLMINQDAQNFATRYTQIVENIEPQVFVTSNFAALLEPKVLNAFPELKFQQSLATKNALQDVIQKNEAQMTFIADEDEFPPEFLKLTYLPLGVRISTGTGVDFLKTKFTPQFRSDISIITKPYSKFDLYRNVFTKYSYFFLAQGMFEIKAGNSAKAIDSFERALGITPFNRQALSSLCKIKSEQKIADIKCSKVEESEQWFDYLKFNKGR